MFLSFFLLVCYLIYRYASHRAFYRCLTRDAESLESTLQKTGNAPLPKPSTSTWKSNFSYTTAKSSNIKIKSKTTSTLSRNGYIR